MVWAKARLPHVDKDVQIWLIKRVNTYARGSFNLEITNKGKILVIKKLAFSVFKLV